MKALKICKTSAESIVSVIIYVELIRINSIEIVVTRYCKLENLGQIRQVN